VREKPFWNHPTLLKQCTLIRMNGGVSLIVRKTA